MANVIKLRKGLNINLKGALLRSSLREAAGHLCDSAR